MAHAWIARPALHSGASLGILCVVLEHVEHLFAKDLMCCTAQTRIVPEVQKLVFLIQTEKMV